MRNESTLFRLIRTPKQSNDYEMCHKGISKDHRPTQEQEPYDTHKTATSLHRWTFWFLLLCCVGYRAERSCIHPENQSNVMKMKRNHEKSTLAGINPKQSTSIIIGPDVQMFRINYNISKVSKTNQKQFTLMKCVNTLISNDLD